MLHWQKMKKITLTFIVDFIHTTSGGTENQLIKILKNLSKEKYEIIVIFLRNTDWIDKYKEQLPFQSAIFNLRKIKYPTTFISFVKMVQYIKKINPDILITFFPLSNMIGVIGGWLANVEYIVSTRRDYGLWLNRWSKAVLPIINKAVDKIIANSKPVKDIVCKYENVEEEKIQIIYNGFENSFRKIKKREKNELKKLLGIKDNASVIGILANLRPMKHHVTFIKSARIIQNHINPIDFIIIGDGPLMHYLKSVVQQYCVEKCIHFVGNQNDIVPYLSILDIGVNCSENEGLSNAIMEYMAYGVPCIVSRAGGNTDLIENGVNGYTFQLDNEKELADTIIRLIKNKELKEKFIRESKEKIEKQFTLDMMINEYDRLFSKAIGKKVYKQHLNCLVN